MGNKLKGIFSDKEISLGGKISFKDKEAYNQFMIALEKVQEDGELVQVDGIASIETLVKNGESVYSVAEYDKVSEFTVAPTIQEVPFELDTELGKKVLALNMLHTNKEIILQTSENAIIFLKFVLERDTMKSRINYRVQPENAKTVKELIESYSIILAFFNKLFKQEISTPEECAIIEAKEYLENAIIGYKKLEFVEREFGIIFEPKSLIQNENCWLDLEELYLVLNEKKVIRLNAKVNETKTTGMNVNQQIESIKVGMEIDITFMGNIEYSLWGNTVTLYTANLLSNAIVKELNKISAGEVKILYGDEDSRPMYISYRAFKTKEETQEEMKNIMEHKDEYVHALTIGENIKKMRE